MGFYLVVCTLTEPLTSEESGELPAGRWSVAGKLTQGQLEEEDGDSHKRQHNAVWDEKCTYKK